MPLGVPALRPTQRREYPSDPYLRESCEWTCSLFATRWPGRTPPTDGRTTASAHSLLKASSDSAGPPGGCGEWSDRLIWSWPARFPEPGTRPNCSQERRDGQTPTRCEALEVGRDPTETLNGVRPHLEAGAVALVGHEPNLSQVVSTLLTGTSTDVRLDLRKGGAACLRLEGTPPAEETTLRWLLTPKVLRSLAK